MKDFRTLLVWQKAHQMTLDVYKITQPYPKEELFGLVNQMRRSSASIPTNIAEGCGRISDRDFCRFLYFAFGSANELQYQIILSKDLNYIDSEQNKLLLTRIEEIKKMISALIKKLL